jgi:hypothetical protein
MPNYQRFDMPVFLCPECGAESKFEQRRMKMKFCVKAVIGSAVCVMGMASVAAARSADVGVNVSTPNVNVRVGAPAPPPPSVTVVERERVIVRESDGHHDNGKHKGHYKKHKKDKKH